MTGAEFLTFLATVILMCIFSVVAGKVENTKAEGVSVILSLLFMACAVVLTFKSVMGVLIS